jgi:hypothetical protein
VKERCCRSAPRCADCPVRIAATARSRSAGDEPAALIGEILAGNPLPRLPDSVTAALETLELARATR